MHPLLLLSAGAAGAYGLYKWLFEEEDMARVFISFDFENDRNYAYILKAMAANPSFTDIKFRDKTSFEIKSDDIGRIKAALTNKIKDSTHTVVVVGKHANALHVDREEIGALNWQNWEVEQSLKYGKKLVMVKLDSSYKAPDASYGQQATWAHSFKADSIAAALNG